MQNYNANLVANYVKEAIEHYQHRAELAEHFAFNLSYGHFTNQDEADDWNNFLALHIGCKHAYDNAIPYIIPYADHRYVAFCPNCGQKKNIISGE